MIFGNKFTCVYKEILFTCHALGWNSLKGHIMCLKEWRTVQVKGPAAAEVALGPARKINVSLGQWKRMLRGLTRGSLLAGKNVLVSLTVNSCTYQCSFVHLCKIPHCRCRRKILGYCCTLRWHHNQVDLHWHTHLYLKERRWISFEVPLKLSRSQ